MLMELVTLCGGGVDGVDDGVDNDEDDDAGAAADEEEDAFLRFCLPSPFPMRRIIAFLLLE